LDKPKYHYPRAADFLALLREKLAKGRQMKLEEADTHLAKSEAHRQKLWRAGIFSLTQDVLKTTGLLSFKPVLG
jgi:hypothetical protein